MTTKTQTIKTDGEGCELFLDQQGAPYSTIFVRDHYENWKVGSSAHRSLILRHIHETEGKIIDPKRLDARIGIQKGEALLDNNTKHVSTRIGFQNNHLYYDLGDKKWRVIDISEDGYSLLENSPIKFKRSTSTLPNVLPAENGDIHLLKNYLNFENKKQYILMLCSIIGAFHPTGPYIISVFQGGHGCSKSTVTKIIKTLVDPTSTPLRSPTNSEKDFYITASNNHLLCIDNLSGITPKISDVLCRISTGGSFSSRTLYTDDEETILNEIKPIILNGIDDIARREDLGSRSIVFFLPPIKPEDRKSEKEFWENFERDRTYIMGGIFNAISCALKNYDSITLPHNPRMADFMRWVCAAAESLGETPEYIYSAFEQNQIETVRMAHDNDPIAIALSDYLKAKPQGFVGTASELQNKIASYYPEQFRISVYKPQTPISFANHIRRIAEGFSKITDYLIEFRREGGTGSRLIHITPKNVTSVTEVTTTPVENEQL